MSESLPSSIPYPQQLEHIKGYMGKLAELQPETIKGFGALQKGALESGALDVKIKELIALAIAVAARCDGCISFHTSDALNAGASEQEITDALSVAVMMGGGPSLVYATHVLEAMEQFKNMR